MKALENYTSALQDVGLDSTPLRNADGTYRWSDGQLEILNRDDFSGIRLHQLKIGQIEDTISNLSGEILAYEVPIQALEKEGNDILKGDQAAIDDQRVQIDQYKSLLNQLDRDMLIRGYIPPDETEAEDERAPEKPVKKKLPKVSFRELAGFILVWLVGEVFMTYVQWSSLRDGKGIEDLIVRSISLGVVLFLIHFVGRQFKRDRRPVQLTFLVFSFLMLFTMLLGPLLLNEAYPPHLTGSSSGSAWALDADVPDDVVTVEEQAYPFWVAFYRNNDMLPGIFVFLFFVIMQTFGRARSRSLSITPVEKPVLPEFRPSEGKNQIDERRKYYLQQISLGEKRLHKLVSRQSEAVSPNTKRLQDILHELERKQAEMGSLFRQKQDLLAGTDNLFRRLEMQLNRYRTEYMNVLKNDPVKGMLVKPEWPARNDLKEYFNLN